VQFPLVDELHITPTWIASKNWQLPAWLWNDRSLNAPLFGNSVLAILTRKYTAFRSGVVTLSI
jgi:hypothetical protein